MPDDEVDVGLDEDGNPLAWDELTEEQSTNRCGACLHRSCEQGGYGGAPWGPGSYCDDPFDGDR